MQLDCLSLAAHTMLRFPQFGHGISLEVFQVLPAPVNLNDAGYIRQTGDLGAVTTLPRALLPLHLDNGSLDLSTLRDPANPFDPALHPSRAPALIWIDLHTTDQTPAATYSGTCQLTDPATGASGNPLTVELTAQNITLPSESHLHFAACLDWRALANASPGTIGQTVPRLLRRDDPRFDNAIHLLDTYIQIAHENKTDLYVTRIQPIVKWPPGEMPNVDWVDFDSVVAPWFTGKAFADHLPAGFWPLPAPDALDQFDATTRTQYWQLAAEHFDQRLWLDRSPVVLKLQGPLADADANSLSAQARQILRATRA